MELMPTVPGSQAEANESWDSWAAGHKNAYFHNDKKLNQLLTKVINISWSIWSIQNPVYAVAQENWQPQCQNKVKTAKWENLHRNKKARVVHGFEKETNKQRKKNRTEGMSIWTLSENYPNLLMNFLTCMCWLCTLSIH